MPETEARDKIFLKKEYKDYDLELHKKSKRMIFILKDKKGDAIRQSIIEHLDYETAEKIQDEVNFHLLDGMYYLMTGKSDT